MVYHLDFLPAIYETSILTLVLLILSIRYSDEDLMVSQHLGFYIFLMSNDIEDLFLCKTGHLSFSYA